MDTPAQVNCSVLNCKYNQSRTCHAASLSVDAPAGAAQTSDGTICSTFIQG
ncbi:MAG: DUF1540 domain-containing protein [Peptococcaceae bacterium]|nr:DUF1540 domain-containing protein [Peptococcaceae bacterium]